MGLFEGSAHVGANVVSLGLDESLASDLDRVPIEMHRDPVADLVLRVVGGRELKAELISLVADRKCNRMMELLLGGRRERQDPLLAEAITADHAADLRSFPRERAGFVEQDGIDLFHQLERPAVFDQNSLVGAKGQ